MPGDCFDRIRLVRLDPYNRLFGTQFLAQYFGALEQSLGTLQHEAMIRSEVWLAFGAVDQEVPDAYAVRHRQLDVRRKRRATHADDAGHLYSLDECFERQ